MTFWVVCLWALTFAAIASLTLKGSWPERWMAAGVVVVTMAGALLHPLQVGNTRWAIALVTLIFTVMTLTLSLRADRWWLLAAGGVLVANGASYLIGWMVPDYAVFVTVGFRRVMWVFLMMLCIAGGWEARMNAAWQADGLRASR